MFVSSDRRSSIQRARHGPRHGPRGRAAAARVPGLARDLHAGHLAERRVDRVHAARRPRGPVRGQERRQRLSADHRRRRARPRPQVVARRDADRASTATAAGATRRWTIRPDGSGLEQLTKDDRPRADGGRLVARRKAHRHERRSAHVDRGPDAAASTSARPRRCPRSRAATRCSRGRGRPTAATLAGGLTFYVVSEQRHAALLLRLGQLHARCPRAGAGRCGCSDSRRLLVARYDQIVLLDTRHRPRDARSWPRPRRGSASRATTAG